VTQQDIRFLSRSLQATTKDKVDDETQVGARFYRENENDSECEYECGSFQRVCLMHNARDVKDA